MTQLWPQTLQKTVIVAEQGDQKSWRKKSPKMSPKTFFPKLTHPFFRGKNGPKIWATSVIFQKLPKNNNHPIGKNSPNLVTLLLCSGQPTLHFISRPANEEPPSCKKMFALPRSLKKLERRSSSLVSLKRRFLE
jgi:hypothetical protein